MENTEHRTIFIRRMIPKQKRENLKFLTDQKGKKLGILLSLKEYRELLEDLHDVRMVLKRKDEKLISLEEIKRETLASI